MVQGKDVYVIEKIEIDGAKYDVIWRIPAVTMKQPMNDPTTIATLLHEARRACRHNHELENLMGQVATCINGLLAQIASQSVTISSQAATITTLQGSELDSADTQALAAGTAELAAANAPAPVAPAPIATVGS